MLFRLALRTPSPIKVRDVLNRSYVRKTPSYEEIPFRPRASAQLLPKLLFSPLGSPCFCGDQIFCISQKFLKFFEVLSDLQMIQSPNPDKKTRCTCPHQFSVCRQFPRAPEQRTVNYYSLLNRIWLRSYVFVVKIHQRFFQFLSKGFECFLPAFSASRQMWLIQNAFGSSLDQLFHCTGARKRYLWAIGEFLKEFFPEGLRVEFLRLRRGLYFESNRDEGSQNWDIRQTCDVFREFFWVNSIKRCALGRNWE